MHRRPGRAPRGRARTGRAPAHRNSGRIPTTLARVEYGTEGRHNGARCPNFVPRATRALARAKLARFVTLLANGGVVDGRRSRAARAEGPAGVDSRCDELLAIRDRFAAARRALDAWHTSAANARSYRDPPHS